MQIPDEIRLGAELLGLFGSAGIILLKLGRMTERFDQHSIRLDTMADTVDKLKETIQIVAVQKDQIQSIRDQIALNTSRTDKTFERIFNVLDGLRVGNARES